MKAFRIFGTALCAALSLAACKEEKSSAKTDAPPPAVVVVPAIKSYISPVEEYVGQAKAQDEVDFVARVEGFLTKRNFIEGQLVKAGDLVLQIEKDQYQAAVGQAEGVLLKEQANLKNAEIDFNRMSTLIKENATAQKNYDTAMCNKMAAEASVEEAKASLQSAKINLSYTDIYAPFDGRVGLSTYSEGNVVGPQSKKLATIVRLDPIRVQFNLNELDVLKFNINAARMSQQERKKLRDSYMVTVRFQDGTDYDKEGEVSYADNQINISTGTLLLQALFPNPEHLIVPGMYLRVLISSRQKTEAILIEKRAVLENQAGKYVMVVGADGKVSNRTVKTGASQGPMYEVLSGVSEGELVVVEGIQKIRPGIIVKAVQEKPASLMDTQYPDAIKASGGKAADGAK